MNTAIQGISIQAAYVLYREGRLWVNRRYQRKLVWTLEEKQKLIDSVLSGYPLPLILLASRSPSDSGYEIIDGMQRLNALFAFIETGYDLKGKRFDLKEFSTARQMSEKGVFKSPEEPYQRLPKEECAKLLNYQLAVTVFSDQDEGKIQEVFSRINAGGRLLSNQEKRQAGVVSDFSEMVRDLSSEIRGDVSRKTLKLSDMPEISIETKRDHHGYKIHVEDTFWCHHGILSTKQLRQSEDEDMIADICASILLKTPLARSSEKLDLLYQDTPEAQKIDTAMQTYLSAKGKLKNQIKHLFSLLDSWIREQNPLPKFLRKTVMGEKSTASSIKTPFYVIFMAFYELVVQENKYPPVRGKAVFEALKEVNKRLDIQTHHATSEQRKKNIDIVKGLIQKFFVGQDKEQLLHGPELAMDFENSLRRSRIEASRYEFKQGFLHLDSSRKWNTKIIEKLAQAACGIANIGPESKGFIHIGVADTEEDANKIKELDSVEPVKVNGRWVVGIDREAKLQNKTLEKYSNFILSEFKKTDLSDSLKKDLIHNMDWIDYRGLMVIRLIVKPQTKVSYMGNECFIREGSHTKVVKGAEQEKVIHRFQPAP